MGQSAVSNIKQATGVVGEFSRSDNQDSDGVILNSASAANNVVGRAVNYVDGNDYEAGVAADGAFAGILVNPKAGVRATLAAASNFLNGEQAEIAKRGYLFVSLAVAADKGDFVYMVTADGTLTAAAPTASAPAGTTRVPGGLVQINTSAAGLSEIYFDIAGSAVATA